MESAPRSHWKHVLTSLLVVLLLLAAWIGLVGPLGYLYWVGPTWLQPPIEWVVTPVARSTRYWPNSLRKPYLKYINDWATAGRDIHLRSAPPVSPLP